MVFSSYIFLFYFLPIVLIAYYILPRKAKHLILLIFSYIFYGWSNPIFMLLMLTSTTIDYVCGRIIMHEQKINASQTFKSSRQRIALITSICSNLCLLGFFKYFNFAVDSYDAIIKAIGLSHLELNLALQVTLPLGISFYTFQSMSYTIDVYRGHTKGIKNFIDFACYISMFPQLVAGPIIRFHEIAHQLISRKHTIEKFARGVAFFVLGLTKKVLLANPCGKIADTVFDSSATLLMDAWYGLFAYAFQIYFDFSGYSDMAIGLGLMLGFVFAKNFDSPYKSQSITEFWKRWHISLSTWLKEYLYIPLGGNRCSNIRTYFNLFLVMLLGGLWHGAAWNFVIWGSIHGIMLAIERLHGKASYYFRTPKIFRTFFTFIIVCIGWVFFRANNLTDAITFLKSLFGFSSEIINAQLISGIIYKPYYIICMLIAAIIVWLGPQTWDFTKKLTLPKIIILIVLAVFSMLMLMTQSFNPFIYFIF